MSDDALIPPSPSEANYAARHDPAAEPLPTVADPVALFRVWLTEANGSEPSEPNAMTLATVDDAGMPDARMVLLKDVDERGFTFYTNLDSAKGRQLLADPRAALVMHWKSLRRQVRIRGAVEQVSDGEADAYFATRSRASQVGAWASDQSRTLESRFALEKKAAEYGLKFGVKPVPRPPHWSGFRLLPESMEFWRDRPFRLHERVLFERADGGWTTRHLYP